MTTYGNPSRISVDLQGGGIAALDIDAASKAVIFARGDPSSGTAQTNDPTQVSGPGELADTFGAETAIVEHMQGAAANGIGYDLLWGVMPATQAVTGETHGATQSFTLGNSPIIEAASEITITDTTAGVDVAIEFRYASPPATPTSDDTAFVNPFTGEVETDASSDYEVDYKYLDWQSAFNSATDVVNEQEVGVWGIDAEAESVFNDAISTVTPLRESQWKMILVQALAQPNANTQDNDPKIDVASYTDNLDDDALFAFGPTREEDSTTTIAGELTGVMGGNAIDDPIIGDALTGVGELEQTLTVPDQEDLEDKQVIPVSNSGSPTIESNVSTSTATDWLRTFFARRLADRLILSARAIARAVRGQLNSETTESIVEEQLADEILDLVDEGVLDPNTEQNPDRWFVSANEDPNEQRELDVSFGFTPTGVVDTVQVTATINY